jgi:antagonist of KipI
MSVCVIRPGLLTTVQDLGRYGHQHEGVAVGGAMDVPALRLANAIVGNPEGAAALEVTLLGPTLEFEDDVVISITGADLSATLENHPMPRMRATNVSAGARLTFGEPIKGCRAYIAFRGGIDVPIVLGSRSTYLRANIGGFRGRALAKEDVLSIGEPEVQARSISPSIAMPAPPRDEVVVRAMRGRHFEELSFASRTTLFSADGEPFRISAQSDRMGYRLDGPVLTMERPLEILSEPVAFGTVQLPPGGNPIILMADRQTTGGYPRVLDIASVDLPLLAQSAPGTRVRFSEVSLEEAQSLYVAREMTWTSSFAQ